MKGYSYPGNSPIKQKPENKLGLKTQGFSNVNVQGVNWGKGVKELAGTETSQGVNVSGINLTKKFQLGKNLSLSLSNPAVVYAKPTLKGMPITKGNKTWGTVNFPFEPKITATYNIPSESSRKRQEKLIEEHKKRSR